MVAAETRQQQRTSSGSKLACTIVVIADARELHIVQHGSGRSEVTHRNTPMLAMPTPALAVP